MGFVARLSDFIWNPWLLTLFLFVGLYYSVRTGFFQLFDIKLWLKETLGSLFQRSEKTKQGGLTRFQALSTALAATIGTGSIAGVATAIFFGGPGAVFWMWVSAFLGMMTGCAEKILSVRYHQKGKHGGFFGGPMYYMEKGVKSRFLACMFSLCCVAASLAGGNLVQANSISTALEASAGVSRLWVGLVVAIAAGVVIFGGVERIGKLSERLVPCMAILFIGGGLVVLAHHIDAVPAAFSSIFSSAFGSPKAAVGGGIGYGVAQALRYGVARGVFTNEAGMGSSAMAHAAAQVKEPAKQGMWGIFEVFVASILVCSVTALVILTSGVYDMESALLAIQSGTVTNGMLGAPLSAAAFATVLGHGGSILVTVCLMLFAFTSLVGWSYYGEQSLRYLTGTERFRTPYRICCMVMIVVGSIGDISLVWQMSDIFNGLMALPNLLALLLLSPEALDLLRRWRYGEKGHGKLTEHLHYATLKTHRKKIS
ncbi:MAG: sodium:alanine symporter family protein [Oscillospiraceae bacterium]|nr:sodium:alanine symporter family protein [Oscillospiraceae bacterium]